MQPMDQIYACLAQFYRIHVTKSSQVSQVKSSQAKLSHQVKLSTVGLVKPSQVINSRSSQAKPSIDLK